MDLYSKIGNASVYDKESVLGDSLKKIILNIQKLNDKESVLGDSLLQNYFKNTKLNLSTRSRVIPFCQGDSIIFHNEKFLLITCRYFNILY